jgi:lipoprotein NlpI
MGVCFTKLQTWRAYRERPRFRSSIGTKFKPRAWMFGLAAMALVLAGCASQRPEIRVVCLKASVNAHAARLWLDTGSSSTILFPRGARRLGLKSPVISEPAALSLNGQTLTAPLPIFRFPWSLRLAAVTHRWSLPDGVVGWPDIRDNILVFDADQRTVRSVPQLPPETSGWLKLKVVPGDWLFLEIPLADGKTGTAEVDTGSDLGLEMPPARMKEWKAAHRKSILPSSLGGVGSFGVYYLHAGWADEIYVGPLHLTDVVVHDMPATQAVVIQGSGPGSQAAWSIGMWALNRMDLVVDAKNGFAYAHPKPPPGAPYPGVEHLAGRHGLTNAPVSGGNWTLADNVRLSGDNLFFIAGNDKHNHGDWAGALADFNRALEINPENANAYCRRGVARQLEGDFSGALSDYDQFIALKSDNSDRVRLYRQTLLWRLGRAPEDFSRSLAACKEDPAKTLASYLAGQLDERVLLTAVAKGGGDAAREWKTLSLYYIGVMHLSHGDLAGARDWFHQCRVAGLKDYDEYQFAVAELGRLDAQRGKRISTTDGHR